MPKMKTRSAAAKRFKMTAKKKLKYKKSFLRHILTKKSRDSKRKMRLSAYLKQADSSRMMDCLPYGS